MHALRVKKKKFMHEIYGLCTISAEICCNSVEFIYSEKFAMQNMKKDKELWNVENGLDEPW